MAKTEFVQPLGVTREADTLKINFSNAMCLYVGSSLLISQKLETEDYRKFLKLRNKWKEETFLMSSGTEIISNAAYNKIIAFGESAIPWIIKDLRRTNDHWFYALESITGQNPIKEDSLGIVKEMSNDWIKWAEENDYL